jgi:predicted TIM-barrel fold metal-dependent hydrolase
LPHTILLNMKGRFFVIIDAYTHILPMNYRQALLDLGIMEHKNVPRYLGDMEDRVNFLKDFPDVSNIVVPMALPWGVRPDAETAARLAAIYNDGVAELAAKYSDIIFAAVASIPINDIDNSLKEAERAITKLGMKGILLPCSLYGEEMDSPRIRPLLEMMAGFDLPIWLHPCPVAAQRGFIPRSGGWEMLSETADVMYHLACSGIFEDYPNIKFVVHHGGSFIPFFHTRMKSQHFDMIDEEGRVIPPEVMYSEDFAEPDHTLSEKYYANLRKFYADTAFYGVATSSVRAILDFYEPGHVIFGTDFPLPTARELAPSLETIHRLGLTEKEREDVLYNNAAKLISLN